MAKTPTLLLILASLALMNRPAAAQPSARLKANRVVGAYVAPKNPAHQPLYNRLKERRVLERLAQFLSPLRLPYQLTLRVQGCDGEINAWYEDDIITVCYEYLEFVGSIMPKEPVAGGLKPEDAIIGPTVAVFLHEVGHAVFDMLQIPILGREEDAADQFAAYLQLQINKDEARILILGNAFFGQKETHDAMQKVPKLVEFADEHGLPAQRYFNMLCMAYGSDRKLFADAVTQWHLPAERAENCEAQYEQFKRAFDKLIGPYVDRKQLDRIRNKRSGEPGPSLR
jgi:Putative metallopeptidase